MELLIAFAFLLILFALAALFRVSTGDMAALLTTSGRSKSLRAMAHPKESRFRKMIQSTLAMMKETGQAGKFTFLLASSLLLLVLGLSVGIGLNNLFLAPVLAAGLAALPFIYIRFQFLKYNRLVLEELEVTLSTISMSYERTENILSAIEENLENIQPPLQKVFAEFVYTVRYVNPNLDYAIEDMKRKIDHSVFKEWCDALKRCAKDRSLKYTLRPIVGKLTKIKNVSGEQKNILFKAVRDFWILQGMTVLLLFVCLYLMPKSINFTIPPMMSNIVVAVNALFIVLAGIKVSFETRDIKFDI